MFLSYHLKLVKKGKTTNEDMKRGKKVNLWRAKVGIICDNVIKNVKTMTPKEKK